MLKNKGTDKDTENYKGFFIEYSHDEVQGWRWDAWTLEQGNKGEHHSDKNGYIRRDIAVDKAKKWIDNKYFSDPSAVFEELFEKITKLYQSGSIDSNHICQFRDKLSEFLNAVE